MNGFGGVVERGRGGSKDGEVNADGVEGMAELIRLKGGKVRWAFKVCCCVRLLLFMSRMHDLS